MESTNQPAVHFGNTLERGRQGQYDFNIKEIFSEAWQKTYGIKATYWMALLSLLIVFIGIHLIFYGINFALHFIAILAHANPPILKSIDIILNIILQIVFIFIIAPLSAGILMISVKHITGQVPISIFNYYSFWKRLWVLPFILVVINFFILISMLFHHPVITLLFSLFFLYITVSYLLFPLLIVEKKLKIWPALESSRKAIGHHWFKVFWLTILWLLIIIGSLLTVGVLFAWTLPMINNSMAILYREMFGVNENRSA